MTTITCIMFICSSSSSSSSSRNSSSNSSSSISLSLSLPIYIYNDVYVCIYIYIYIYIQALRAGGAARLRGFAISIATTPHNKILPDCFTPPNAKAEHGSASTSVLLSLG